MNILLSVNSITYNNMNEYVSNEIHDVEKYPSKFKQNNT